jgi:hypothetical protein
MNMIRYCKISKSRERKREKEKGKEKEINRPHGFQNNPSILTLFLLGNRRNGHIVVRLDILHQYFTHSADKLQEICEKELLMRASESQTPWHVWGTPGNVENMVDTVNIMSISGLIKIRKTQQSALASIEAAGVESSHWIEKTHKILHDFGIWKNMPQL